MAVPERFCDEKHSYMNKLIDQRFKSMDDALVQRTMVIDAHFNILNNAQARLDRDRDDFIRKSEYKIEHRNLVQKVEKNVEDIDKIELWKAEIGGKASRANLISFAAVILSVIFSLIHLLR